MRSSLLLIGDYCSYLSYIFVCCRE